MSVIRHETFVYLAIACDEPGCTLHFSGSGDSADDVRDQAVTSGWIVMTDLTGEKQWHFCPRHAKAGLSARPVEPSESPSTTQRTRPYVEKHGKIPEHRAAIERIVDLLPKPE